MNNNFAKCILEENRDEYFNQVLFIEFHVHVVIEDLHSQCSQKSDDEKLQNVSYTINDINLRTSIYIHFRQFFEQMFSQCSIIRSIISDDCHQFANKFINLQNVHYRFCQLFTRMLFEKKFERYKHFSKSKLAINEVCDNIHKNEMIERDLNVQNNENLNLNLEILKKIIFNLICSLFHHFFEKDSFENVNISSQIFHKVLEKRAFDRSKKQVYIQNVLQQFIVESLLNESKKWFFFSHEASFILINNWTNKKKKNQISTENFSSKAFAFRLVHSFWWCIHCLIDVCSWYCYRYSRK
jgi:hypothetical protein